MNEMKNYNQNGFDKYRENVWDNIEKICRKSTLIVGSWINPCN